MNKDKVKGELPSFSMLVVKCSATSPMLKHCAQSWKKNDEHLVVKVILELHVAFSPFVLQIPHG
jgi:hypothetical protein